MNSRMDRRRDIFALTFHAPDKTHNVPSGANYAAFNIHTVSMEVICFYIDIKRLTHLP